MKKIFVVLILFFVTATSVVAQNKFTDSLHVQLKLAKTDTTRALVMAEMCYFFRYSNIDSSIFYGKKALALAQSLQFDKGEANALNRLGLSYREKGDLPRSMELQFKALDIAKKNNLQMEMASCYRRISLVYVDLKDIVASRYYLNEALKIDLATKNKRGETIEYMNLGIHYLDANKIDSASYFEQKAYANINVIPDLASEVLRMLGDIEVRRNNIPEALSYYNRGIGYCLPLNDYRTASYIYANMAKMYHDLNKSDSAIRAATHAVEYGQMTSYKKGIYAGGILLSELYASDNPKEALRYYKIAIAAKDSLYGAGNMKTVQAIIAKEGERKKEIDAAKATYQSQLKLYGLMSVIVLFVIIAIILYRNNRQKQKTNRVLESTLTDLKSTQTQLIQSEKMASLGELTAGIAHEIQNPLNFVNNFSEVSSELIAEMNAELDKGDLAEAKAIAIDVKQNLEKINHHGKRADAIVKGMLQHSRSSSGVKEPTDINVLVDEYIRLCYHGLRAKDNSFNATIKTDFDASIGKVDVTPQDLGRVILNLLTNAFYAVDEKKKSGVDNFEATVSVSTHNVGNKVEIRVADNGNGIPQHIVEKIFQPFFTTKPTGQGTGLGLSLSYDIIKSHGGELKVKTIQGEGAIFTIQLEMS